MVREEVRVVSCLNQVLFVRFTQHQDRIAHSLYWQDGRDSVMLLESVEDNGLSEWPTSPPIQECHVQQLGDDRKVVFGVGMAGQSHWSMTAETAQDPAGIVFDVACRTGQTPQRLGSSYRVRRGQPRAASGDLEITLTSGRLRIELMEGPANWEICDNGRFQIFPRLPANLSLPRTVRWRYRCRLVE
jgi:hypothetical protein